MALRSPALSGTQTGRSNGDSGWSMKTSAKVSDMSMHKFYTPNFTAIPGCLGAIGPELRSM